MVALIHAVLHITGRNAFTGVITLNGLWKIFIMFRHRKTDTCAKRKNKALKTNFIVTVRTVVNGHLHTEIFNCLSPQQQNGHFIDRSRSLTFLSKNKERVCLG